MVDNEKPDSATLGSPLESPEGGHAPMSTAEEEEPTIADDLLEALQKERRKGKWRRQSSGESIFNFEGLSPIEQGLLGLLSRCLDKIGDLEDTIREKFESQALTLPGDSTDAGKKTREDVDQLKKENITLKLQNAELKEGRLQDQTRSMRENLVLHGVVEVVDENTEATLKSFLKDELEMDSGLVDSIQISASHRLGRKKTYREVVENGERVKKPAGPRPIVARFVLRDLKDKIRRDGNKTLREKGKGKLFKFSDQFPGPILDRRRVLMPILLDNVKRKNTVKLVVDRLYINDRLFRDANTYWIKDPQEHTDVWS